MSATNENITLIGLKIEGAESGGIVDKLTESIKTLIQEKEKLATADEESLKQKALLEKQIEKEAESLKKTKQAIEAEEGSIAKLREANKRLTQERNNTSMATEAGRKKIKELNDQLDKNNEAIKTNVDAYAKQKINIGNYASALDNIIPGLGGMTTGIQATTKASLAFIATPIGAIIGALGVVLLAVTTYLKGSEEGADKFAKVMAQAGAVIKVLIDRLIQVGDALVSFFTGDWAGGAEKMRGAFKDIGDEIQREIDLAGQLAEALDELEERELANSIAVSNTTNEIKKLLVAAKDRNKTERERIDLYDEALALEKKQLEQNETIQLRKLELAAMQLQMDNSQHAAARGKNESALEFVERLLKNEKILFDDRKALADQLIAYNNILGESLVFQEKIAVKRETEAQKEKDWKQKEIDAWVKLEQQAQKSLDKIDQLHEKNEQKILDRDLDSSKKIVANKVLANVQILESDEIRQQKQKEADDHLRETQFNLFLEDLQERLAAVQYYTAVTQNFLNMSSQAQQAQTNADLSKVKKAEQDKLKALETRFKSGLISEATYNSEREAITAAAKEKEVAIKRKAFEAEKKNRIAQTIATTLQSAINAFNSFAGLGPVGIALGIAAAAAATYFGFKQVKGISETQFTGYAKGGLTGTRINRSHGIPINRSNGDNLLATVRTGEVILNERQQAALGGPGVFRRIGVPGFATGGITGSLESYRADQSLATERMFERLSQEVAVMKTVLVLQDFEAAQSSKNSVEIKSTL